MKTERPEKIHGCTGKTLNLHQNPYLLLPSTLKNRRNFHQKLTFCLHQIKVPTFKSPKRSIVQNSKRIAYKLAEILYLYRNYISPVGEFLTVKACESKLSCLMW